MDILGGIMIIKAKDYKSITDLLKKKYKKNFYDFEDFQDVLIKIRKRGITWL